MPGQEQKEDTNGNGAGSGSNADGTGTNPNYSMKQGDNLYGPPSCHESASIPFDDGKGVLVFGGLSYEFTTSNVGDSVYVTSVYGVVHSVYSRQCYTRSMA